MRNRWWFQGFWEKKSLTIVGAKNHCNQLGLVQEETLAVFYTGMPRETVRTTRNEVGTQEILTWSKHTLQYRKWRNRLTKKAWTVWRPVLWLKLKNPLSIANKMKDIVMWLSTSFRVSWLQAWKQMHLWLSLLLLTSWWWEQLQRENEEEGTQGAVPIPRKKTSKVMYLKTQIQWILFYGKLAHHEILRMHLVRNWGHLTTSRLWQQSSVELGDKTCELKPNIKLQFILLWTRSRQRSSYVYCVDLSSDTMDTLRSNPPCATYRDRRKYK